MVIPAKKLKSGFTMPVLGLGTWQMGGLRQHDPENDDARDIHAIRTALDLGIKLIDTAEVYANGYAEMLVAQATRVYPRSELFLTSKVYTDNLGYDDVLDSCKQSLMRLAVDYLDLYLVHAHNPLIPLEETMRAMSVLKDQGLIKEIGVSNFSKESLAEAQKFCKFPIVCDQVHYNLMIREAEVTGLLKYCQQNDIMITAYRPVQRGMLMESKSELLDRLAEKYGKTPTQVAINWLIAQPNVVTISKSSSIKHLQENLGACGWLMDPSDVELLREHYPDQQEVSDLRPLG